MEIEKKNVKLTNKDKILIAFLSGWTLIHFVLLCLPKTGWSATNAFWPFDKDPLISTDYDFSEFAVYGLIPWVVFGIYKLLNIENK